VGVVEFGMFISGLVGNAAEVSGVGIFAHCCGNVLYVAPEPPSQIADIET